MQILEFLTEQINILNLALTEKIQLILNLSSFTINIIYDFHFACPQIKLNFKRN